MRIYIAKKWGTKIGKNTIIYPCNIGSEPYLISIGDHCEIAHGVSILTHDGATWVFREDKDFNCTKYGPVIIRDNSMIGINSIILPGVEIGPNSVVGAGSVVTKNVPPNSVYAGNPAKFICTYEEYRKKCIIKNTGNIHGSSKKDALLKLFENRFSISSFLLNACLILHYLYHLIDKVI
jgi:acetyltransferase-like isoleucine patch superfamily enzyme